MLETTPLNCSNLPSSVPIRAPWLGYAAQTRDSRAWPHELVVSTRFPSVGMAHERAKPVHDQASSTTAHGSTRIFEITGTTQTATTPEAQPQRNLRSPRSRALAGSELRRSLLELALGTRSHSSATSREPDSDAPDPPVRCAADRTSACDRW